MPSLAPMVKRISPSVVNIATRGTIKEQPGRNPLLDDPFFRRFFDAPQDTRPRERQFQSAGSGVIVDPKGYIVTNRHVVEKADRIRVKLESEPEGSPGHDAKLIGMDQETDLAVIKIDVEGFEAQVLRGARRLIAVLRPWLAIDIHPEPFGDAEETTEQSVRALLGEDGYQFERRGHVLLCTPLA